MEKQIALKERLMEIVKREPMSVCALAKEVGIGAICFYDFWRMKRKASFRTILMIESYLDRKEREINGLQ